MVVAAFVPYSFTVEGSDPDDVTTMQFLPVLPGFRADAENIDVLESSSLNATVPDDQVLVGFEVVAEKAEYDACPMIRAEAMTAAGRTARLDRRRIRAVINMFGSPSWVNHLAGLLRCSGRGWAASCLCAESRLFASARHDPKGGDAQVVFSGDARALLLCLGASDEFEGAQ